MGTILFLIGIVFLICVLVFIFAWATTEIEYSSSIIAKVVLAIFIIGIIAALIISGLAIGVEGINC